jgi:hypothetical protein
VHALPQIQARDVESLSFTGTGTGAFHQLDGSKRGG